jgi:diaminopimelate epimerase
MVALRFDKYEGLGNDFIVVDTASPELLAPEQVSRVCDRHFGVGADGVLFVLPPGTAGARATMVVVNADGSRPEMCGNGLRCVALHLARHAGLDRGEFVVDTDAGARACAVERAGDGAQVAIDLGRAELGPPFRLEAEGLTFERVSTGNPHAITFDSAHDEADVDRIGRAVSEAIPGGCNVEFVQQLGPRRLRVTVWERGVGRTLACGTGAAAVVVAAAHSGRVPYAEPIEVCLPGGSLDVTVQRGELGVTLRGPARHVFSGEAHTP